MVSVASDLSAFHVEIKPLYKDEIEQIKEIWSHSRYGMNHSRSPMSIKLAVDERNAQIFYIYDSNNSLIAISDNSQPATL